MFDLSHTDHSRPAAASDDGTGYAGPERRGATSLRWKWLAAALDEIDYGILLLDDASLLLHVNRAARVELDGDHPVQLLGRELRARDARDDQVLRAALQSAAQRSLRRLLAMGPPGRQASVSVVPLGRLGLDGHSATLVILGKRQVGATLALESFARCHGLTASETRVLGALCQGVPPADIAEAHGVALCTVRTQIGSIRQKTGAASIRELLRQVAVLPPLMGVLAGEGDRTRCGLRWALAA